ncbi:tautomerase family protein [Sphingomonas sp.]|uniref:tautomerase family protein n=1 Tax=Sphingomonas sp. TaxID=28214 RepID=UPI002606C57D|nr:tautomerase family protein [Sphingomonas sp.]
MPVLNITIMAGRDEGQKQLLASALTDAVHATLGSPKAEVRIFINEVTPDNFSAGGMLKSVSARASAADKTGERPN